MIDCLFCKIIRGEIPCHKVYEDSCSLVFLDVNPTSKGHALVIPKSHYENIHDISEESLHAVMKTVKKMSSVLIEKLGASGVNIVNASGKDAQQSVFHIHFHIVPRYKDDGLDLWFHGRKTEKPDFEDLLRVIKG